MIINRSHIPWALLTIAAALVIGALYFEIFRPGLIPAYLPAPAWLGRMPFGHRSIGATPLGIIYGVAAFLIFIFATLLGMRKRLRSWRIGRVETWMRAHIWLSILTVPLVILHCGFHSGSIMTTGLLALYAIVMVSGFYGLALQQFIPGQMMDRLSHEVIYDQIPYLKRQLVKEALQMDDELTPLAAPVEREERRAPVSLVTRSRGAVEVALDSHAEESRTALRTMLEKDVLPYLRAGRRSRSRLSHRQGSDNLFKMLKAGVDEPFHPKVDQMQRWTDQRRQMDLQTVMHHWLHYWLFVHVPASMLLLLWTAWHAITGLLYY